VVVPGGVARDLRADDAALMRQQVTSLERELAVLRDIYDEHAGLQDRFRGCGEVTRELAMKLGLTGFAARASGLPDDLRCDFAWTPYDTLGVRRATRADGDVAARVAVRFDETVESLRLVDAIWQRCPTATSQRRCPKRRPRGWRSSCAEGWRGPVFIALKASRRRDPGAAIRTTPLAELAGDRARGHRQHVPDFPLHQQVVQPSYSGHDL
jgi:Ni,Fe-hydrogenase III large subunit